MKFREYYRKILLVILIIGVLLCGIGTGVALAEYSSFEYLGEKEIGGDALKTDTFEERLSLGENEDEKVYVESYGSDGQKMTLETSEKVPKDRIQFVVEYNSENVQDIHIGRDESEEYDDYTTEEGITEKHRYITYYLNPITIDQDEFASFMDYKDELLQNLKKKRFYNYTFQTIKSVKVVVHPSNKDAIELTGSHLPKYY